MLQHMTKQRKVLWGTIFLQIIILLAVVLAYLLHRGHAYVKSFSPEEYILPEQVTVGENVAVDANSGLSGTFLCTPELSLKKGTYIAIVGYNVDRQKSYLSAGSDTLGIQGIHTKGIELMPDQHQAQITMELTRDTPDLTISASFSGEGCLEITSLQICETSARYRKNFVYAVFACMLLTLLYFFYRSDVTTRKIILALSAIFLTSCYPLFSDYLTAGHDIPFHLLRIEGIKEGLETGMFPVKIHPVWAKEHGYAVGVFYGDLALYFPAILRIFGFSIQMAYKYFIAAIELGTVLLSYYSFRRMFHSRKQGLVGCFAYTFCLYRLTDVFTRAAVGEAIAMMFLPLILCGFYLLYQEADKHNWWKYGMLTAIGITGVLQSHILSCEMLVFVVLIFCLAALKRTLHRYTFYGLATGGVLSVLLNLGFLIPFLDYYQTDVMINSPNWVSSTIGTFQSNGMFPIQLVGIFLRGTGSANATWAGASSEPAFSPGILLIIGLGLFIYELLIYGKKCRQNSRFLPACYCLVLGCLTLFMSTCYFPWDALADTSPLIHKLVYSLEFPWRLLAPSCVLLTFVLCFALSQLELVAERSATIALGSICLVLSMVNASWYFYNYTFQCEPYRVYDTYELNSMTMYSYDYLPTDTAPEMIDPNRTIPVGIASMENYQKNGIKILCQVMAEKDGGYIDFPITYYKYYKAVSLETGESLPVSSGYNGQVRVSFPGSYHGTVKLSFVEPLFWRISELVSLVTLFMIVVLLLRSSRKGEKPAKEPRS